MSMIFFHSIYFKRYFLVGFEKYYLWVLGTTYSEENKRLQIWKNLIFVHFQERDARGPGAEGSFTLSQFHYLAADVFGAGTETAHTTMRWLLLDLAQHQQKQVSIKPMYREISESNISFLLLKFLSISFPLFLLLFFLYRYIQFSKLLYIYHTHQPSSTHFSNIIL